MKSHIIPRRATNIFSEQQLLLTENQAALQDFINLPFSKENFIEQIKIKSTFFTSEKRQLLTTELERKYNGVDANEASWNNIQLLKKEETFTITTGHQLSLMTGPLYFIYKILHVIKQCKELNEYYPNNHFVPVYWMASEDHDFEEIKSFLLFGKTIAWESEQSGAVGRMNLYGMPQVFDSISQFFANHPESEIHNLISKLNGNTYGEAFFQFIHAIFGNLGLIILDGDNKAFKTSFKPLIQKELESSFSYKLVTETNIKLQEKNFKIQVQPREINLFYLSHNKRERIILKGENFEIGSQSFTKDEILQLLEEETVSFSPNVVLRPLFQEYILPNLCYVGGVGELSYWLEFKSTFEAAGVPFPLIQARTSIVWIDAQTNEKINSQELSTTDLFKSVNDLKQNYLQNNAEEEIDFSLLNFQFEQFKTDLTQKTESIDASINSWMGAEFSRMEKQFDGMKSRLEKSVKSKHEKGLKSIEQIKEKLFPNGGMQERTLNFFQMCPDGNYTQKLVDLYEVIEPFNDAVLVLTD